MTSSTSKRLSPSDWATIVTLYQRGEKNLRELAEMFGITKQSVSEGLRSRGIEKNSRLNEVVAEVVDKAREARDRQVKAAADRQENYAKWTDLIAKLTVKKITTAEQNGDLGACNAHLLVLKTGMAILSKAREETWEILDIKDLLGENAELPDLNVGEYSEEELEAIREQNERSFNEGLEEDDPEEDSDLDDPD